MDSTDPLASAAAADQLGRDEALAFDTPQALLGLASALMIEGVVVTAIWYVRRLFT